MTAKNVYPVILPPQRPVRRCLSCRAPFASAGPHERICPGCKESEAWLAGLAEFPCHAAGEGAAGREAE